MKLMRIMLALLLGMAGTALAATPEPPPQTVEEFRQRAQALLQEAPDRPAAGVVLVQGGEVVWSGGVGLADRSTQRSAGADTPFRIGSITKMFVAMAVMQQVERGKLRLDDRVADLAPEVPLHNRWEATHPVRVVHLLEHTAGFDDMHYRNWLKAGTEPSLAGVMQDLETELSTRWQPGHWHAYSNPGYALAAYLVEKTTGTRFDEYVTRELLQPLGMDATEWGREASVPGVAIAYDATGRPVPWLDLKLWPAGALVSTPRDMAKLSLFFASHGQSVPALLSAESIERIERAESTASARAGLEFGYGLANYTRQIDNLIFRGHDGDLPGYQSTLLYSREHDAAMVVMVATGDYRTFARVRTLAARYLLRGVRTPEEGAFDAEARPVADRGGYYAPVNPKNSLLGGIERTFNGGRLSVVDDRYRFAPVLVPGAAIEYFPMPNGKLRDPGNALATGVLVESPEGRAAFTDIDTAYVRGSWWSVALPQYALALALALMLSTLPFALVWVPRWMFGELRDVASLSTRIWPLLATLTFIAAFVTATRLRLADTMSPNLKTMLICGLGWLFGLLALVGLLHAVRTFGRQRRLVALHSLLAALAVAGMALWLARIGMLGVRLWAW